MRKCLNFVLFIAFVMIFEACSGMVQTNPVPNPTKYALPKLSDEDLNTVVAQQDIKEFDDYAREFFQVNIVDYQKSIWSIGLSRGHYDQSND